MATLNPTLQGTHLRVLADRLDIPDSYYDIAKGRYESLGKWFERKDSTLARFRPDVYPQGSFAYGTVKPAQRAFDLDLVCELPGLSKLDQSQAWVKEAVGEEIISYAIAHGMKASPEATKRCWHLEYAEDDGLRFHMDVLPAVSEDAAVKALLGATVPPEIADLAIAFTDTTHPRFHNLAQDWPMSNPRGFVQWFEARMRMSARRILLERVADLPAHRWNTPLQATIRILKEHRDTMFTENPEQAPASIILTTLAAQAYNGEMNVPDAVIGIVRRMPTFLTNGEVLNPTNPGENFADKWKHDSNLQQMFWVWYEQLGRDLDQLGQEHDRHGTKRLFEERFGLTPPEEHLASITIGAPSLSVAQARTRQRPWGQP